MTIPNFLSKDLCDFRYTQLTGITDVSSILTALTAQLVTAPATAHKWTEAPAGTFTSSQDPNGRYIVCAFSRIAATNLQMVMTDHNGIVICTRRMQISGAGTTVDIYTGRFYVLIESVLATVEPMMAFLTNDYLDSYGDDDYPAFGNAHRSSADAADGNCDYGELYGVDYSPVPAAVNRFRATGYTCYAGAFTTNPIYSGRYRLTECTIKRGFGGVYIWTSRLYHALVGIIYAGWDREVRVVFDDGTVGTFRKLWWGSSGSYGLCVRTE